MSDSVDTVVASGPIAPVVHINGTSKAALADQIRAAFKAGKEFETALAEACPNARDYYVAGPDVFPKAQAEHKARLVKLAEILRELGTIAVAIQRQGR
jgi:hypothetical protein